LINAILEAEAGKSQSKQPLDFIKICDAWPFDLKNLYFSSLIFELSILQLMELGVLRFKLKFKNKEAKPVPILKGTSVASLYGVD
jgi:hypothetical protein